MLPFLERHEAVSVQVKVLEARDARWVNIGVRREVLSNEVVELVRGIEVTDRRVTDADASTEGAKKKRKEGRWVGRGRDVGGSGINPKSRRISSNSSRQSDRRTAIPNYDVENSVPIENPENAFSPFGSVLLRSALIRSVHVVLKATGNHNIAKAGQAR